MPGSERATTTRSIRLAIARAQCLGSQVGVDARLDSLVAGYRVERLLGRGGMGAVYLAADVTLDRKVAVKLLVPELSEDASFRERFLRESRIAAGEHVYLSDFGLTKQAASQSGLTATGTLVGTLDYVAPEQIQGQPVDGRADVYSLACLVHECLTGRPPFRRDTDVATLWAHIQEPPPATGDPAVDAVLARAL